MRSLVAFLAFLALLATACGESPPPTNPSQATIAAPAPSTIDTPVNRKELAPTTPDAPWVRVDDPEAGFSVELPPNAQRDRQLEGMLISWRAMTANEDRFLVMRLLAPTVDAKGIRELAETMVESCKNGKLVSYRPVAGTTRPMAEFEGSCTSGELLVGSVWGDPGRMVGVLAISDRPAADSLVPLRRKLDGIIGSLRDSPAR